jgi:hypothetical protein
MPPLGPFGIITTTIPKMIKHPPREEIHVVQKYLDKIPAKITPNTNIVAAVGVSRASSGILTVVYLLIRAGSSSMSQQWVTEDEVCLQSLEKLWLEHGRIHSEGQVFSLRTHRSVHPRSGGIITGTIQPTLESRHPGFSGPPKTTPELQGRLCQPQSLPTLTGSAHSTTTSPVSPETSCASFLTSNGTPALWPGKLKRRYPRKFSRRTRTGCLSCRARRKKCDETKPSCEWTEAYNKIPDLWTEMSCQAKIASA